MSTVATAQKSILGIVKSSDNGHPVTGASVFLNNTSIGAVTNYKGEFNLIIPTGRYELVISSIGYLTQVKTISSQESTDHFIIQLQPEVKELQAVVVEPFEKDGWAKWGQLFLDNFIGISSMAKECRIKNKETIRFRYSKTNQIVTAHTTEPLIIENDYLGYKLQYLLEEFSYNFKTKMIFYVGYPLFQPMKGNNAKMK
ncbi:MAG TPA: carboxypeptidase-like regulatory domain-containing protein, partial [Chitinophagaceae bacterium]|nr:carboxypeptidase-like regulatory domain-containing protein [Chitinophagaceae bacterium]